MSWTPRLGEFEVEVLDPPQAAKATRPISTSAIAMSSLFFIGAHSLSLRRSWAAARQIIRREQDTRSPSSHHFLSLPGTSPDVRAHDVDVIGVLAGRLRARPEGRSDEFSAHRIIDAIATWPSPTAPRTDGTQATGHHSMRPKRRQFVGIVCDRPGLVVAARPARRECYRVRERVSALEPEGASRAQGATGHAKWATLTRVRRTGWGRDGSFREEVGQWRGEEPRRARRSSRSSRTCRSPGRASTSSRAASSSPPCGAPRLR